MGVQFVGVDVDILLELNDYFSTLTGVADVGRLEDLVGRRRHEALEQLAGRPADSAARTRSSRTGSARVASANVDRDRVRARRRLLEPLGRRALDRAAGLVEREPVVDEERVERLQIGERRQRVDRRP